MADAYDGTILTHGDDGYESARRAAVLNARVPQRYPEVIVLAESHDDTIRAVYRDQS
jgi:hypothetical protein